MKGLANRPIALLLMTALALVSWAQRVEAADTWTRVVSANFEVIGNASPERLRELAHRLEQFRTAVGLLLPTANLKAPVPTRVYLFRNDSSFRPFKPRRNGKIVENVGGYFHRAPDANVMVLPADGSGFDSALQPLFHEYTHFVLHNNLPNIPLWLDEGLAEYYGTFTVDQDGLKGRIGSPIAMRLNNLTRLTPLPLSRLLVVDRSSKEYSKKATTAMIYAQSWALVHYLILGENGRRRPMVAEYVRQIASGASAEASAKAVFGPDLKAIEQGLESYSKQNAFPVLNLIFKSSIGTELLDAGKTMSEHEASARLAELSLIQHQVEDAEKHLARARASAPEDRLVQIATAKLLLEKNDGAGALVILDKISAQSDAPWVVHTLRGIALSRLDRESDAVSAYRTASLAKPDLGWIQVSLGIACSLAGRDDEAMAAFAVAERLQPHDSRVFQSRALLQTRRGAWDRAAIDADTFIRMEGWENSSTPYMALVSYFSRRFNGDAAGAKPLLDEAVLQLEPKTWPEPVFAFLQKRVSEADLLSRAKSVDEKTEAYAYAGLSRLVDGDRDGARKLLEWVVTNGNRDFTEFRWAQAELGRLGAKTP